MPRVFALSVHADYACAHSGACCTAGWAIPVEPPKRARLGASLLVPDADGACRFFDRTTSLCGIHRDRGEQALPDACRHFPRVALVDDRGVHVTLSHFCPTAAGRLFEADGPVAIAESPAAFPSARDYDGLDARGEWPPLVHETLLFDPDSFDAWEAFAVRVLTTDRGRRALARLATAAERLRRWAPSDGAMRHVIERLEREDTIDRDALAPYGDIRGAARSIVADAIPSARRALAREPPRAPGTRAPGTPAPGTWHQHQAPGTRHRAPDWVVIGRYLAAKAFASWTAYQGRGVRTLVAELVLVDALVRDLAIERPLLEAIREADRLLIHLADRKPLVDRLGNVELA